MSNFTNLISDDFKQLHVDMITETLRGCSVPCQLIYGITKWSDCPNCTFNQSTGKSSGRYQAGGPIPFTFGVCPYCAGRGRIGEEQTENIDLCPIYDYRSWIKTISSAVKSPEGFIQTMCVFENYEKILQAKEIIINTSIVDNVRSRFERHGEPEPCGFGNASFLVTMWKRIENA